ncbi:MAG: fumarylacetoacetase [Crocinitomicaceae bacterium]|nr:fumarylacetoacetase [Crocinitomicaceae bacterium]
MHGVKANDPKLKSWVDVPAESDFPIQNLPFGVFRTESQLPRVGVAIGEKILDLKALHILGYLENLPFRLEDMLADSLNPMMRHGKEAVSDLRNRVSKLLRSDMPDLRDREHHVKQVLVNQSEVQMLLPVKVGDYTDFYSSMDHARNVGMMFRDPDKALLPNWKYLPVGYHGRASSIIVSGTPVHRPMGQTNASDNSQPVFGPTKQLDFELEMAFITFDGKPLGQHISTVEADDYIFGLTLFNDWSARDIQRWEYVPLGPFLAKNFASSMSPWIVTLDALEPFRVMGPVQEPAVMPYLQYEGNKNFDIHLEVSIAPSGGEEKNVSVSNYRYMYWNMAQQLAHHTVNGCNIRCGDVMASGTISGPTEGTFGSMLEITWKGSKPVQMPDGSVRTFINDNDKVIMKGYAEKDGVRIGFGECVSEVLPAL